MKVKKLNERYLLDTESRLENIFSDVGNCYRVGEIDTFPKLSFIGLVLNKKRFPPKIYKKLILSELEITKKSSENSDSILKIIDILEFKKLFVIVLEDFTPFNLENILSSGSKKKVLNQVLRGLEDLKEPHLTINLSYIVQTTSDEKYKLACLISKLKFIAIHGNDQPFELDSNSLNPEDSLFLAPELLEIENKQKIEGCDSFSFAVLAHYLLTEGKFPFSEEFDKLKEKYADIAQTERALNTKLRINKELKPHAGFFQKALKINPEERPTLKTIISLEESQSFFNFLKKAD